jgi:hypothetical protein
MHPILLGSFAMKNFVFHILFKNGISPAVLTFILIFSGVGHIRKSDLASYKDYDIGKYGHINSKEEFVPPPK